MPSADAPLNAKLAALDGPEWDSSSDESESMTAMKRSRKNGFGGDNIVLLDTDKEGDGDGDSKGRGKGKGKGKGKSKGPKKGGKNDSGSGSNGSNVIYMGHLPTNFEEAELLAFLSQFGDVTGLRLSRSKRTGHPKGYAFARFKDNETADDVARTMSGYFLMERRLVCHLVPLSEVRLRRRCCQRFLLFSFLLLLLLSLHH